MNVDELYQKTIQELQLGHRGLTKYSNEELDDLTHLLKKYLRLNDLPNLEKVLCLIEHTANFYQKFEPVLLDILNSSVPDTHIIFALNCARKHIIEARFAKGNRLEFQFLETLKRLLYSKNPEVVEWTLRLIEGSGNQGIYFLKEFDKIKPGPWKWFNSHQRAVREIITLLERRWSPLERPKS